jgi:hypothetical protein
MDFDHAFHQAGFFPALQMMVIGSLLAPGVMGRSDLYRLFAGKAASFVVTFGPLGLLGYVLFKVAQLA